MTWIKQTLDQQNYKICSISKIRKQESIHRLTSTESTVYSLTSLQANKHCLTLAHERIWRAPECKWCLQYSSTYFNTETADQHVREVLRAYCGCSVPMEVTIIGLPWCEENLKCVDFQANFFVLWCLSRLMDHRRQGVNHIELY